MSPASAHRWNHSWTVLLGPNFSGSSPHRQPLRNRKMMPLSVFRQFATRRPAASGPELLEDRLDPLPSASGTSQIVSSGLSRAFSASHGCGSCCERRVWLSAS